MFGGINGPVKKVGRVAKETLKNGAGGMETVAVTREKRSTTEFVLTRTLELSPEVGAGLANTCIRTVCPANTFESVAKGMELKEARTALKPLVSTENVGVAPSWATTMVPGDAAGRRAFPLVTVFF